VRGGRTDAEDAFVRVDEALLRTRNPRQRHSQGQSQSGVRRNSHRHSSPSGNDVMSRGAEQCGAGQERAPKDGVTEGAKVG